jgi:hypothetical protein
MAKNLIPEIARMLGVELGEVFKLKGYEHDEYRISEKYGLARRHRTFREEWQIAETVFRNLIYGRAEIVKLPWKPTMYEEYWTFGKLGKKWIVGTLSWKELPYEILLFDKGWVYRTRAEAAAALPAVAAELGVEYEI